MSTDFDEDAQRQSELWNRWASTNDLLYGNRDPSSIVAFLNWLCPEGEVLELGAGTGRIAIPLSMGGRVVTAIEVSDQMIKRFLEAAQPQASLGIVRADMVAFSLPNRSFSLVYAARSTFFQITTQPRQLQCLRTIRDHVHAGARLVLDCYLPSPELLLSGSRIRPTADRDDAIHMRVEIIDRASQRISYREVDLVDGSSPRVLPVEQRYCWPAELDLMAQIAGFELETRFGNYDRAPFDSSSDRHVSVYRAVALVQTI